MPLPTIEPLGDQALLLRWHEGDERARNQCVHAFAARLRAAAPAWLVDSVPAYASLAVFFAPAFAATAVQAALTALPDADDVASSSAPARRVEIPVCYGGEHGPDLDDVAAACGLSAAQVIARHAAADYLVAMLGFSPGFPYLLGLDPALAVPRLATPRRRVAAGSVGIGGAQTGLYPVAGPGGWRLIGRTPLSMFDPDAEVPSRVLPGDRVRFVAIDEDRFADLQRRDAGASRLKALLQEAPRVEVLAGGMQTTVQDLGRVGWRHLGVGGAGALDGYSARIANLLVGNDENAALLEITLSGPRLRFSHPVRIAITGADIDARVDGVALPGWRPIALPAGSELVFGGCRRGARACLAIAGGLRVAPVLGSAGTDLRAGFGGQDGRALAAGDVLALAPGADIAGADGVAIAPWWIDPSPDLEFASPATVRVLPGHDATSPALALCARAWRVAADSNRQGLRLQGEALAVADAGERRSEPVAAGTVQLPPDGQPIVLLGEAQTIGGYPRIGHVIAADLPRLAQLRPGDTLRFEVVNAATANELACAQRQRLTRIGLAIAQRDRIDRRPAPK
jgi:KipI family sensor histidine kinase inhibitor